MSQLTASVAKAEGSNPGNAPLTLRALRQSQEKSLRDVEELTGIHRGRLSELERGLRWPRTRELRALEYVYGVSGLHVAWVIVVDEDAA